MPKACNGLRCRTCLRDCRRRPAGRRPGAMAALKATSARHVLCVFAAADACQEFLKARIVAQRIEVAVVFEPVATAAAEFARALQQVDRAFGFACQAVVTLS